MPRRLSNLIVASEARNGGDLAATAGEKFGTNVAGAGAGVQMSHYIVSAINWESGYPQPPDSTAVYNDGDVFNISWSVTEGPKGHLIRNLGSSSVTAVFLGGAGASVTKNSVTIPSTNSGSGTLQLTVRAPYSSGTGTVGATAWFNSFTPPNTPTHSPGGDGELVRFQATVTAGASSVVNCTIELQYTVDGGAFNDAPTDAIKDFLFQMNTRARTVSDYSWEWQRSFDGGSTYSAWQTGASVFELSSPGDPPIYVRVRSNNGAGTISDWVPFTWADPRPPS